MITLIKYVCSFSGKQKGAIGVSSNFRCVIEACNKKDAELKLYDIYDHIHGLTIKEAI